MAYFKPTSSFPFNLLSFLLVLRHVFICHGWPKIVFIFIFLLHLNLSESPQSSAPATFFNKEKCVFCPARATENSKIFVLPTKLFSSLHFPCLLIDWMVCQQGIIMLLYNWSYSIVNIPFVKSNIINFHLWSGISQYHKLIMQLNVLMSCLLPQMSPLPTVITS